MKKTLASLVLLGALTLSSCDDTTTTQQKTVVCQTVEDGTNLRAEVITSNKHYWNDKQDEVRAKIEEIVNGGKFNVTSVKTFYSDAYLTSAEIKYSVADDCNNQNLRVIFIHSNKHYWNEKQDEVKPKLDEIVNSGIYNIQDVNTIMLSGYLVAAEVYYHDKKK